MIPHACAERLLDLARLRTGLQRQLDPVGRAAGRLALNELVASRRTIMLSDIALVTPTGGGTVSPAVD